MNEEGAAQRDTAEAVDFEEFVVGRLKSQGELLATMTGHLAGLKHLLEMLIATHPNRKSLHATWQAKLPSALDAEIDHPLFAREEYREGFQAAMSTVSKWCEAEVLGAP